MHQALAPSVKVTPVFPVDTASKTAMATAERWSGLKNPAKFAGPNTAIPHVTVVTLERRAEGGRAYKVLLPEAVDDAAFYVDMREDVFLEALLTNGVARGTGVLEGPFVWGRLNSQLRLVRVGSALHAALLVSKDKLAAPTVKAGKFEPGAVYLTRKDAPWLFVGFADTEEATTSREHYRAPENVYVRELRNVPIWCELQHFGEVPYGQKAYQKRWDTGMAPVKEHPAAWYFKAVKSPALLADVVARVDLGENVLARVRELTQKSRDYRENENRRYNSPNVESLADLAYYCLPAHVREPGTPRPDVRGYARFFAVAQPYPKKEKR